MKTRLERGKNMKRNKGFTLIELLAVIVILAIIALIAVPVVMNIISRANKSAFKDSAYGVLKAGENYYMNELLDAQGMTSDKVFDFSKDTSELEINGSKPTNGKMIVNTNGKVAMAIHNGRHCVTKGFNDDDVTISDDIGNCKLPRYSVGDVVYYNPVEDKICTDYVEANSALGVKEGCMRWYVYATDGGKAKLILDHNTTGKVAWVSKVDYNDNNSYGIFGNNNKGAITLKNQLRDDTANWKVEADIIEVEELLKLTAWYEEFPDKSNWVEGYLSAYSSAWDDIEANVPHETTLKALESIQKRKNYMKANHSKILVPDYMYEDIMDTCKDSGNEEEGYYMECETFGFWTKSPDTSNSSYSWHVYYFGDIRQSFVMGPYGLRPVVIIDK